MRRDDALDAAKRYLKGHPEELARFARSALGMRLGVPLAALRWLGAQVEKQGKVQDLVIDSTPPGIRVGANIDLMSTPVRASATVFVERVQLSSDQMTIALRLEDVSLALLGSSKTPVAMLIRSGALDLSRPANLVAHLPDVPPVVVEARDNRIVLDLLRAPKLAENPLVRKAVGVLSAFVTVHGLETDENHVDLAFRAFPNGLRGAASAIRRHIVRPSLRFLLPSSTNN